MEDALTPIYDHLILQVAFGGLIWANIALFTRIWSRIILQRFYTDFAAITFFQRSGYWLGALTGFVAITLPEKLGLVAAVVVLVVVANCRLASKIESRTFSDA